MIAIAGVAILASVTSLKFTGSVRLTGHSIAGFVFVVLLALGTVTGGSGIATAVVAAGGADHRPAFVWRPIRVDVGRTELSGMLGVSDVLMSTASRCRRIWASPDATPEFGRQRAASCCVPSA